MFKIIYLPEAEYVISDSFPYTPATFKTLQAANTAFKKSNFFSFVYDNKNTAFIYSLDDLSDPLPKYHFEIVEVPDV
jgi:hypothetical protein